MAWDLTGNNGVNDTNNYLGTRNDASLVIKTNTNNAPANLEEVMRVTPSDPNQGLRGSVGIGTTQPAGALHAVANPDETAVMGEGEVGVSASGNFTGIVAYVPTNNPNNLAG